MTRLLTKFRTHFVLVLFTAFVGFAHAETPSIDSTTVDSAATSASVDSVQKLSPLDHLGHNMLLSAFGWPSGHSMTNAAQGHHRPAILRRHQRRRAQRENISQTPGTQPCGSQLCVLFGTQHCVPMKIMYIIGGGSYEQRFYIWLCG